MATLGTVLSQTRTLTIDDLLRYPRVVWDRAQLSSKRTIFDGVCYQERCQEIDRLEQKGLLRLQGEWSPRDPLSSTITMEEYVELTARTEPNQALCRRITRDTPRETILAKPRLPWDPSTLGVYHGFALLEFKTVLGNHRDVSRGYDLRRLPENIGDLPEDAKRLPWDRRYLSANPTLTVRLIRKIDTVWAKTQDVEVKRVWDWRKISLYVDLTDLDQDPEEPDFPWLLDDVPRNKTITVDRLCRIQRQPRARGKVNLRELALVVPIDDIVNHRDIFWPVEDIFRRSMADIERYLGDRLTAATIQTCYLEGNGIEPNRIARKISQRLPIRWLYQRNPGWLINDLVLHPLLTIANLRTLSGNPEVKELLCTQDKGIDNASSLRWTDVVIRC